MEQKLEKKSEEKKFRNFAFTVNNYTEEDIEYIKNINPNAGIKYIIFAHEVGENGTPHLQGFASFKSPRSASAKNLNKMFGRRAHVEVCRESPAVNYKYCIKGGKVLYEYGTRPEGQGTRTDLRNLKDEIMSGKKLDDIILEVPEVYNRAARTLTKIEDIYLRRRARKWNTKGLWLYGKTGCGKSHRAFEGYEPETHYSWCSSDKGWWDGYTGQETVIIDEFRGQIPYGELLKLVDQFPLTVSRRGREPMPFLAKKVIITSSLAPSEVYHNLSENDTLDQLERRFEIVNMSNNIIEARKDESL